MPLLDHCVIITVQTQTMISIIIDHTVIVVLYFRSLMLFAAEAVPVLQRRSAVKLRQVLRSSETSHGICKASTAGERKDGERNAER